MSGKTRVHNVFYVYGGKNEENSQLENNVTRAFLYTLSRLPKKTQRSALLNVFKKAKIDKCSERAINLPLDLEYDCQIRPIAAKPTISKATNRILLVITTMPSDCTVFFNQSELSIADGMISGQNLAVIIEAKVGRNPADTAQINRYKKDFFDYNCQTMDILWQDVYEVFGKIETRNQIEKFLIEEFRRYLAMTGNAFDIRYIIDEGYDRKWAGSVLNPFMKAIAVKVKDKLAGLQYEVKADSKNDVELWGLLVKKNDDYKKLAYTVSLDANGASIL